MSPASFISQSASLYMSELTTCGWLMWLTVSQTMQSGLASLAALRMVFQQRSIALRL